MKGSVIYIKDHPFADFYDIDFREDWTALRHLLGSQWWQRGWVYQEIVCAQDVMVLFGNSVLDWNTISKAIQLMSRVSIVFIRRWMQMGERGFDDPEFPVEILLYSCYEFAEFMIESRMEWRQLRKKEAIELLCHAQKCNFTDPRDRIYAFVGLADPEYRIIPDYQIDIPAALRIASKRIVLHKRRLDILGCCIPGTDELECQRRGDIPSWTADWTSRIGNQTFIYDSKLDMPPFRASSDYPSAASFHSYNMVPDSILRVQCIFIDQLSDRTTMGYQASGIHIETFNEWVRVAGLDPLDYDIARARSGNVRSELYSGNDSMTLSEAFRNVILRGHSETDEWDEVFFPQSARDSVSRVRDKAAIVTGTTNSGALFRSRSGYLGLTKKHIGLRADDLVCIILGANVPFILRKTDDYYILVGDAYVEGLMLGEGIKLMQRGELVVETIDIH